MASVKIKFMGFKALSLQESTLLRVSSAIGDETSDNSLSFYAVYINFEASDYVHISISLIKNRVCTVLIVMRAHNNRYSPDTRLTTIPAFNCMRHINME